MKKLFIAFVLSIFCNLLLAQDGGTPQQKVADLVQLGKEKADNGNWNDAVNTYTSALQQDPKNADAYHNRAIARFNLKDYRGALMDYSKAINVGTSIGADCVGAAYYGRGQCYYALGMKDKACLDFVKSSELGNSDGTGAVQNFCN